jgi:PAS domain S-box-containing protein
MATILIFDDEQDVRDLLFGTLSQQGHRVVQAADAAQAWALFQQELQKEVDQRRQLESKLRDSEERYSGIIASAMDAIVTIDEDEKIVLFNAAAEQMFGLPAAEAIDKPLNQLIPERFRAVHSQHIRDFVLAGVTNRRTGKLSPVVGIRKDGSEFPIEASISQVVVHGARFMTAVLRDISDRQAAEHDLRETAERLKVVSRRVIEIQESERRHLARELHDEIGQVLSAVSVNLKIVKSKVDPAALPRLEESIQIVDEATDKVRNLSLDLRPSVLDDFGLESALRWFVDRLSARTGLRVHLKTEPHSSEVPFAIRNTCYRVIQEALTNVVRHASARQVWVEFVQKPSEIMLSIRDDGIGFDVSAARWRASKGHSMGLLGMHERVALLDGRTHLQSEPGKGTTIQVQLPLAVSTAAEGSE